MAKKTILWVAEGSPLKTGFSGITYEILKRLHQTGKYNIVEIGSYTRPDHPELPNIPWKFYSGFPNTDDDLQMAHYNGSVYAQFGSAVFNDVCLETKPDIVIDIRDHWMSCEWQLDSAFIHNFKYMIMPTIDGEPQRVDWMEDYCVADRVLTYSDYGVKTLEKQGQGTIKVFGAAKPAVDHMIYQPVSKDEKLAIRKQYGIREDTIVFTTVMRNQKRKLYPDLLDAFNLYLKKCRDIGREDIADRSILLLHTSFPDAGFNIPKLLIERDLYNKVLMSYVCQGCKDHTVTRYRTEVSFCQKCRNISCFMPNTMVGVPPETMAKIYQMSDCYIQYSICEGLGMPVAEAKSCGILPLGVGYTATKEQVIFNNRGTFYDGKIDVARMFYEGMNETEQKRALPDNSHCADHMIRIATMSPEEYDKMSKVVRQDIIDNYSYDGAAKMFEAAIDSIGCLNKSKTWDSPKLKLKRIPKEIQYNIYTHSDFVDWCLDNILDRPDLRKSIWRHTMVRDLNAGFKITRDRNTRFTREKLVEELIGRVQDYNRWEQKRFDALNGAQAPKWSTV